MEVHHTDIKFMKPYENVCAPVSESEINRAVLYLKVTRTYLWRIGLRILVPPGVCIYSTILEQACSLSRFQLKSFEVVHNEYNGIPGDKFLTFDLWR